MIARLFLLTCLSLGCSAQVQRKLRIIGGPPSQQGQPIWSPQFPQGAFPSPNHVATIRITDQPQMPLQISNQMGNSKMCCSNVGCGPCPYPIAMPVYPIPQPAIVVTARTFYERVRHDHPPLRRIQELIRRDRNRDRNRDRRRKRVWISSSGSDMSSDCEDSSSDY